VTLIEIHPARQPQPVCTYGGADDPFTQPDAFGIFPDETVLRGAAARPGGSPRVVASTATRSPSSCRVPSRPGGDLRVPGSWNAFSRTIAVHRGGSTNLIRFPSDWPNFQGRYNTGVAGADGDLDHGGAINLLHHLRRFIAGNVSSGIRANEPSVLSSLELSLPWHDGPHPLHPFRMAL